MKTAVAGVPDMYLLTGFAQPLVLKPLIDNLFKLAPLRHMKTSRGFELAAAMTNCGSVGWVSGRGGYSYSEYDPASGKPWPPMPAQMKLLAEEAAQLCGYDNFHPDACLINRYLPGKGMGAHRDNDERDLTQPIVSVSLGLAARFFVQGKEGRGKSVPVDMASGDVIVWGDRSRLFYHGVRPLKKGNDPVFGSCRINLTFRKAQ